jgi:hypothetical protein
MNLMKLSEFLGMGKMYALLGCNLTVRRNISLPSSVLKKNPTSEGAEAGGKLSVFFHHEDGGGMFLQYIRLPPPPAPSLMVLEVEVTL